VVDCEEPLALNMQFLLLKFVSLCTKVGIMNKGGMEMVEVMIIQRGQFMLV
jgi:hypothetical protein